MSHLRWKRNGKDIVSTNGDYRITEKTLVYAVEYKGEFIGYANSQKEAGEIAQKHFDNK